MQAKPLNDNQQKALAWARERSSFTVPEMRNAGISSNTMNSLYVRKLVTYDTSTHRYTATLDGVDSSRGGEQ
jgi:hypothetical protein